MSAPTSGSVTTIQILLDVTSGSTGAIDNISQALGSAVENGVSWTTAANGAQVVATAVGIGVVVGVTAPGWAVGASVLALSLQVAKAVSDGNTDPNKPIGSTGPNPQ
ncbi:hypothetical protein [Undibacterium terreum]|uniref:Uncharacterized protein n=1 Tax=Undibacterium terreum TaxID=1224302 RepID=A0A916XEV1_9BURK|nr:hypothetical protein [Undibacterium terreum]GGC65350.1 hypothetical protein GCM10011396_10420 [Undibacterium terreum]